VTERVAALELVIRALVAGGQLDEARRALAELEAIAASVRTEPLRAAASLAAGMVAAADGDHEQARRSLEDASELFRRSGAPFEAATTRAALARVLARLGRKAAANEQALAARETLVRLGARVDAILGPFDDEPRSALGLSRREFEVLRLLAEGLSNRQIAERLVLSEHTVHRHVANILRKLGVGSRSAAAAVAAKHQVI
jgi:DNA-binding NarL/FixJ family response regulator